MCVQGVCVCVWVMGACVYDDYKKTRLPRLPICGDGSKNKGGETLAVERKLFFFLIQPAAATALLAVTVPGQWGMLQLVYL